MFSLVDDEEDVEAVGALVGYGVLHVVGHARHPEERERITTCGRRIGEWVFAPVDCQEAFDDAVGDERL